MIVRCVKCSRKVRCAGLDNDYTLRETARSVLLDNGLGGDGTGTLYIVMPYVVSMSAKAGPYCPEHALKLVDQLNRLPRWHRLFAMHSQLPEEEGSPDVQAK